MNFMMRVSYVILLAMIIGGCAMDQRSDYSVNETQVYDDGLKIATFAGGCFWCMEPPFSQLDGVIDVFSGYTGGTSSNPTYEQVSSGMTRHQEAVQIIYDPEKIEYIDLLDVFWKNIDPTDDEGQFVDRGHQYTTGIFYHDESQKELAMSSKEEINLSGIFSSPVVTPIKEYDRFYLAENYHQDYADKNPLRYKFYRSSSGRDDFIEDSWQDEEDDLRNELDDLQYRVTQEDATEPAFDNKYWDNDEEGIYVDIVSGEPLFSSKHKYKSGTGWPSFWKPLEEDNIIENADDGLFMKRTEIRSKNADSHLGHVFDDGPEPTGLRYCMNSAAMKFIPKEELKEEGYEEYLEHFSE